MREGQVVSDHHQSHATFLRGVRQLKLGGAKEVSDNPTKITFEQSKIYIVLVLNKSFVDISHLCHQC
jgi:hypothetical protein